MTCPRCTTASLEELDRDGITIDRCNSCRGIWLDRGELEKLLSRGREAEQRYSEPRRERDEWNEDSDAGQRGRGRRSWFDIFD
jgi:Zn-finger nucleic acid-binding protein